MRKVIAMMMTALMRKSARARGFKKSIGLIMRAHRPAHVARVLFLQRIHALGGCIASASRDEMRSVDLDEFIKVLLFSNDFSKRAGTKFAF